MRGAVLRGACLAAVALAAVLLSGRAWTRAPHWSPDGLFYESQRLEVGGETAQHARDRVFFADPAYRSARDDAFPPNAPTRKTLLNRRWVSYSSRLYRRRWAVPAAAEAISPLFGRRSLLLVSLAGYLAFGLLVHAWLRLRFGEAVSAAVAILTLGLAPLRTWSFIPLTDSWGLALLVAALYAGTRVLRGERRWLAAFAAALLVGAFTRDDGLVVIVAALVTALLYRRRDGWLLAAVGVVATLPALLAFGVPARDELGYTLNDYQPPPDGWSFVAHRYPHGLREWLASDRTFLRHDLWFAAFLLVGLVALLARARAIGAFGRLATGALVGGVVFLLLNPNPAGTALRLELVLVPAAACGLAALAAAVVGPAGAEGLEPPAYGFGDRRSTN